jgi:hypothetical protein
MLSKKPSVSDKENLKNSVVQEKNIHEDSRFLTLLNLVLDDKIKKLNEEIESIDVKDIDNRLSKLQDLIKFAKS